MIYKNYTQIVVNLAFIEICHVPQVAYRMEHSIIPVGRLQLYAQHLAGFCRFKVVHGSESIGPVHTNYSHKMVEVQFRVFFQVLCQLMPVFVGDAYCEHFAFLKYGIGYQLDYFFLNICHDSMVMYGCCSGLFLRTH